MVTIRVKVSVRNAVGGSSILSRGHFSIVRPNGCGISVDTRELPTPAVADVSVW